MKKIKFVLRYFYHKLFSGFYHLGWKVAFDRNVRVTNPKYISLGDYVSLDIDSELAVINGHYKYSYDYRNPALIIEAGVGIGKGTIIFALKSIRIKKNAMIGPYCFIADYDHGYQDVTKPIVHQPLTNINPVIIEEGAWIGAHATICSGVTIGKNAVIGAGSVVTKDIPSNSLAVGIPAEVIKRFNFKTKSWERS